MKPHVDLKALWQALDIKREMRRLSWRQAARAMGVSASTLTRMRQGCDPSLTGFTKMVVWLDVSADRFIKGRT